MSWTDEQYALIKFQQLHTYDAFANPDKVGLGRCGCGQDMYWSSYHVHFADELLKLGWSPPENLRETLVEEFRSVVASTEDY